MGLSTNEEKYQLLTMNFKLEDDPYFNLIHLFLLVPEDNDKSLIKEFLQDCQNIYTEKFNKKEISDFHSWLFNVAVNAKDVVHRDLLYTALIDDPRSKLFAKIDANNSLNRLRNLFPSTKSVALENKSYDLLQIQYDNCFDYWINSFKKAANDSYISSLKKNLRPILYNYLIHHYFTIALPKQLNTFFTESYNPWEESAKDKDEFLSLYDKIKQYKNASSNLTNLLQKKAKPGDNDAAVDELLIAMHYAQGSGVVKDFDKAANHFFRAFCIAQQTREKFSGESDSKLVFIKKVALAKLASLERTDAYQKDKKFQNKIDKMVFQCRALLFPKAMVDPPQFSEIAPENALAPALISLGEICNKAGMFVEASIYFCNALIAQNNIDPVKCVVLLKSAVMNLVDLTEKQLDPVVKRTTLFSICQKIATLLKQPSIIDKITGTEIKRAKYIESCKEILKAMKEFPPAQLILLAEELKESKNSVIGFGLRNESAIQSDLLELLQANYAEMKFLPSLFELANSYKEAKDLKFQSIAYLYYADIMLAELSGTLAEKEKEFYKALQVEVKQLLQLLLTKLEKEPYSSTTAKGISYKLSIQICLALSDGEDFARLKNSDNESYFSSALDILSSFKLLPATLREKINQAKNPNPTQAQPQNSNPASAAVTKENPQPSPVLPSANPPAFSPEIAEGKLYPDLHNIDPNSIVPSAPLMSRRPSNADEIKPELSELTSPTITPAPVSAAPISTTPLEKSSDKTDSVNPLPPPVSKIPSENEADKKIIDTINILPVPDHAPKENDSEKRAETLAITMPQPTAPLLLNEEIKIEEKPPEKNDPSNSNSSSKIESTESKESSDNDSQQSETATSILPSERITAAIQELTNSFQPLLQENHALRQENKDLRQQVEKISGLEREIARLRAELQAVTKNSLKTDDKNSKRRKNQAQPSARKNSQEFWGSSTSKNNTTAAPGIENQSRVPTSGDLKPFKIKARRLR